MKENILGARVNTSTWGKIYSIKFKAGDENF